MERGLSVSWTFPFPLHNILYVRVLLFLPLPGTRRTRPEMRNLQETWHTVKRSHPDRDFPRKLLVHERTFVLYQGLSPLHVPTSFERLFVPQVARSYIRKGLSSLLRSDSRGCVSRVTGALGSQSGVQVNTQVFRHISLPNPVSYVVLPWNLYTSSNLHLILTSFRDHSNRLLRS